MVPLWFWHVVQARANIASGPSTIKAPLGATATYLTRTFNGGIREAQPLQHVALTARVLQPCCTESQLVLTTKEGAQIRASLTSRAVSLARNTRRRGQGRSSGGSPRLTAPRYSAKLATTCAVSLYSGLSRQAARICWDRYGPTCSLQHTGCRRGVHHGATWRCASTESTFGPKSLVHTFGENHHGTPGCI